MADDLLADSIAAFLAGRCDLQRVRGIEADESGVLGAALWDEIEETGFADALVDEAQGGAGLRFDEAGAIALACGRHAVPVALSTTMVARAALAQAGVPVPAGAIAIATARHEPRAGELSYAAVPFGMTAAWLLVSAPAGTWLLPTGSAQRVRAAGHCSLAADLHWAARPADTVALPRDERAPPDWRAIGAVLLAAQIAGAADRLSEMAIGYANERVQFGKPIGRQQAIQQQLSVMAEHSFAARTAALIGLSGPSWCVDPLRAALAKARTGEAATAVAAIAHAVHGAIGVTEEFDLQLFTRRLHEWRMHYGGESYWNRRLGEALLQADLPPLQFVQDRLAASTCWPG